MTNREIRKVLTANGLPEPEKHLLVKNCIFVLPINEIASGVCLNRSSDPKVCRLVVFHQPLYMPFDCVVFWISRQINPPGCLSWNFDPDPRSEASERLVAALRDTCLPLANQRLTVSQALAKSNDELTRSPDSLRDRFDKIWSLCMIGSLDLARDELKSLRSMINDAYVSAPPRQIASDWSEASRQFVIAESLEPLLSKWERSLTGVDFEREVRELLATTIACSRRAIGL